MPLEFEWDEEKAAANAGSHSTRRSWHFATRLPSSGSMTAAAMERVPLIGRRARI